jgi:response regulator RpfG family c-di-GMP phosphodiesterase
MMKAREAARILVIDAHRNVMEYYRRLLEAQGYGVETSTFRETNQEEIERWHPDLIVFDLLVDAKQEQQAWSVIQQLKASPHLACIPLLICIAAFVLPDFLTYVCEQQVTFLFKPLDTRILSRQIHVLLTSA